MEAYRSKNHDLACEDAFTKLQYLTILTILTRELILETDASFHGLGAVLSQHQDKGLVVLGYARRMLKRAERNMNNYSSMKLELLALYWAVTQQYHDLLIGSKFVVYTNNNPAMLDAVETHWATDLSQFNFSIKYRSGRSNRNPDDLSRKLVHGKEPSHARLEELVAALKAATLSEGSSFVPESIQVCIKETTTEILLQDCHVRKPPPISSAVSLPSIGQDDLCTMQA